MPHEPQLILAPIRGSTDRVYRKAFMASFGGFDRAVAPFIKLKTGHPLRPVEIEAVAPEHNLALPTIPQVHTNDGTRLAEVLREFADLGHREVNLNLGCPYPMVTKRGRGAGLLPFPDKLDALLEKGLSGATISLSVKLRLGLKDPDDFIPVMAILNRYPLSEVILHPRIAKQMYGGSVDLDRAEAAFNLTRHPFILNGDINSLEIVKKMEHRFSGATGFMLGRGALKNPFLPMQIKGKALPDEATRQAKLKAFHHRLVEGYEGKLNGRSFLLKMREHWLTLSEAFTNPKTIRKTLSLARTPKAYHAVATKVFEREL